MNIRFILLSACLLFSVACSPSENISKSSSITDEKITRAREIFQEVSSRLDAIYPSSKGSVWAPAPLSLKPDWLVQGPDRIWGATADQIPESLDCDSNGADCDASFKRQLCSVDSDCVTVSTLCQPLQASVSKLGQTPTKMCLGMGDALIDRFYNVMVSADKELDFVSLSMPSGRFYTAMINALSVLSQKESVPAIRLMFSGYSADLPNFLNSTDKVMGRIVADTQAIAPTTFANLKMNIAWLADGKLSWNHAKILVADGTRSLQGGHNFWDERYLSPQTIYDLSMENGGEGAAKARDFANLLWDKIGSNFSAYPSNLGRISNFVGQPREIGSVQNITVGRMGTFGENVSDTALQYLIDSSKNRIAIVQQELYKGGIIPLPFFQTFVFDNLVNAAARGVTIEMVLTNPHAYFGYTLWDGPKELKAFIDAVATKLKKEQGLDLDAARAKACERVTIAPFRFSHHIDYWPSKPDEQPGLHTKLVIVDEAAFYLGSHNLYPSNLQEFGNIVTDAGATAQLQDEYWNKIWTESRDFKFACPY